MQNFLKIIVVSLEWPNYISTKPANFEKGWLFLCFQFTVPDPEIAIDPFIIYIFVYKSPLFKTDLIFIIKVRKLLKIKSYEK